MFTRPHWSYSQLAQYMRCPLQYFFERVLRLPKPFSPSGLVLGSAVHAALADYHRRLQANRPIVRDSIHASFLASWTGHESERPIQYKDKETRSDLIDEGMALLELYQVQEPTGDIIGVEQTLIVPIITSDGEILDRPLVAVVDLLHREEEGLVVTEFKTSSRKFDVLQADTALQATAYAHAVHEKHDQLPSVQYTVLVRTKTPQVQNVTTVRSKSDLHRFGDIVQSVQHAIDAGAFYPIENPINCSGCPFRVPCLDWRGPLAPVQPLRPTEEYVC